MTETNQIGTPIPVNIQLAPKIFDTYKKLVKGQDPQNEVYVYRLKEEVCLLKPSDTKNVKNALVSCLSLAVENRRLVCPQEADCPMMHDSTSVTLVDKRKERRMADDFATTENIFKPKKERRARTKKNKTNPLPLQAPVIFDEASELDTTELIHASDTFIPETIASELMDKAECDIKEDATDRDIYLARKARIFLELITKSYKTNNPIIAVENLLNNAVKKIPEVKGKYQ